MLDGGTILSVTLIGYIFIIQIMPINKHDTFSH